MIKVNFNEPSIVGKELEYINKAILNGHISGNGHFTKLSERYLSHFFSSNALLTTSCTHSLEMCAKLLGLGSEDEITIKGAEKINASYFESVKIMLSCKFLISVLMIESISFAV